MVLKYSSTFVRVKYQSQRLLNIDFCMWVILLIFNIARHLMSWMAKQPDVFDIFYRCGPQLELTHYYIEVLVQDVFV